MAVYTHVTIDDLSPILQSYGLGKAKRLEPIADGIENTNYLLVTETAKYILTLFEKRTRPEDLPYFIALMQHFNAKGIPCPQILANSAGKNFFNLHGKTGIIASFLEGKPVSIIDETACFEVGRILARMHVAGQDFRMSRATTLPPETWQKLIQSIGDKANGIEAGLAQRLRVAFDQLPDQNREWPSGPVHADLFPDNVFFENNKVSGVIDFYFAYQGAFIYDIMLTLNAWCGGNGEMDHKKAVAFLNGYESIRPLTAAEAKELARFGRAAALRIISTRLYDWFNTNTNALVKKKDPLQHVRLLEWHQQNDLGQMR